VDFVSQFVSRRGSLECSFIKSDLGAVRVWRRLNQSLQYATLLGHVASVAHDVSSSLAIYSSKAEHVLCSQVRKLDK
jgi:hypothetical protein